MLGLDMVTGRMNGLVTGQLELEGFDRVGQGRTLMADRVDGSVSFLHRPAAHDDVVTAVRLEQGFDDLIADAIVAASDQHDRA